MKRYTITERRDFLNSIMLAPSMMCIPAWENTAALRELIASGVDLLHMDVMDGAFVPNLMLGTEAISQLRRITDIPLDIHLMIERPEDKLGWFDIQPGEWVSVHAESTHHLQRVLAKIRDLGANPMVALNPATPLCMIEEVLPDVDAVLLMTVNPGYAGQALIAQTIDKIARLRAMLDAAGRTDVGIEVDGNVSFVHGRAMYSAGANMFVCGSSSIFAQGASITKNAERFRRSLTEENI